MNKKSKVGNQEKRLSQEPGAVVLKELEVRAMEPAGSPSKKLPESCDRTPLSAPPISAGKAPGTCQKFRFDFPAC